MISALRLENFKCFPRLDLPLGRLTLLTGLNGMGKSTVLQAILCLLQSAGESLSLNGEFVQLGTANDVYYEGAQTTEIVISLDDNAFAYRYEDKDANELCRLHDLFYRGNGVSVPNGWQYLNCERSGPRSSFPMSDAVVRGRRQLGTRGEYTAHFLSVFGEEPVTRAVQHEASASPSLRDQTDAWLREVSPGSNVRVYHHTEMDLVRLSVQFRETRATSREYRPTNVGFGITYLLPVIVAGLAARPGSLLMVENPEAHLHPRGQARMGQFLARVAAGGVQVLVETHSDHLLNGIRVSVHDGLLPAEDVAIHYFERQVVEERFVHGVTSPRLDRDGRIDQWPEGFFDEWETALQKLLFPAGQSDGTDLQ